MLLVAAFTVVHRMVPSVIPLPTTFHERPKTDLEDRYHHSQRPAWDSTYLDHHQMHHYNQKLRIFPPELLQVLTEGPSTRLHQTLPNM